MHYSKELHKNFMAKPKANENRSHNHFFPKEYQDEKTAIAPKNSDSGEVHELKNKLKLVMTKLSTVKKDKQTLERQNKNLQNQIINLQGNLRQMVSGFSNTSSNFPVHNQIGAKFAQFYKYQCLDMFFDVLCPQMSMKGIIVFFYQSFEKIDLLIKQYFAPSFQSIKTTGCFDTIQGPILNVMRKAFQTTYHQILQKIQSSSQIKQIVQKIQEQLNIGDGSTQADDVILKFLQRIAQLNLYCYISDPPFEIRTQEIGEKVQFNSLLHDPFDGFIKNGEECWIVLPSVRKSVDQKQTVTKPLVLQLTYDLIN